MTSFPRYFENIRVRAEKRWEQLESDPELAGPWHQLFKQVQSPRHVLSELLQNADDAGATEAFVEIDDRYFVFSHNGEDFTEEHFASLCRFGYSNKRALHTIGFRGIGFKSTFSLGDTVELYTPTLSVAFDRRRFTAPRWIGGKQNTYGKTQVRVAIRDEHRKKEIEKNLQEWLTSPVSLLFFNHIRRMRIGTHDMHWGSLGAGPVPDTEWMALHNNPDQPFLIAKSQAEEFPTDALDEIRQERLLGDSQEMDFPPCKVEIVLGAKGRLYVVLPTGVETPLPFACNAPFIQDPARLKIKDPETSPTNRWLLERAGKLAASVMLRWLQNESASVVDRSGAFDLFPDVDRDDNSLEGSCATIIEDAFGEAIGDNHFLLTHSGELKPTLGSVIIPDELVEIWPTEQVVKLFDEAERPPMSSHISKTNQQKLMNWGLVEEINKEKVLDVLQSKHLPKPETWTHLLRLWAYVAPEITSYRHDVSQEDIRIVPAQGKSELYSADEVVRLAEKRLLQSKDDWEFLANHLLVLNQNWPRFLADRRRNAEKEGDENLSDEVKAADAVLSAIGLGDTSDVSEVIEKVASEFFSQQSIPISKCVQLTQIAAKLDAKAGESFRFVTRDCHLYEITKPILFDSDGTLEAFFEPSWCLTNLLHTEYSKSFTSCTSAEWFSWITSGRSNLLSFAPLINTRRRTWGRKDIESELRRREVLSVPSYSYVTNDFLIEDWDFEGILWKHWHTLVEEDQSIWGQIVERIFNQLDGVWTKAKNARILQVATTGSTRSITYAPLLPAWIMKLRELPCLRDTKGFYRKPSELLRRTPETESLMDVEPFIHGHLDSEATRPLLKLLGVRDVPTGPDRLLNCLRALAQADNPPAHEVEKWYRRLDQMVDTCSTNDFANIKKALSEEKIVLTEDGNWSSGSGVFLSSDEEDVPGAAIIRASVRDLSLWRKIGIAERPTADLAIQWLKELPSGKPLSQEDSRRVQSLLRRHAVRIWHECKHWLNLAGEWAPIEKMEYALSMQTLVAWSHLHEWVKQKTADFQRLPTDITEASPFTDLPHLSGHIEDRFHRNLLFTKRAEKKSWLSQLGIEFRRIILDDDTDTARIRALADDLAETMWQIAPGLELVPYIGGTPAGTPRRADVVWLDRVLYVDKLPDAKLARLVPDRLGKIFGRSDMAAAFNYCFGRTSEEITEYVEENFKLAPREEFAMRDIQEPASTCEPTIESAEVDSTQESKQATDSFKTPVMGDEDVIETDEELDHDSEPAADVYEDLDQLDTVDPTPPKDRPNPKPAKPRIIERFALNLGFKKDGEDRFYNADGSWIAKTYGGRFPWERRTAAGEIVCYYLPKEHCLEMEPLQLDADVWGLIDKFPETYVLVLSNPHGEPVEVSGIRLRTMLDGGKLTLYPATYRLVFD